METMRIKFRVWASNDANPKGKMYYPFDKVEPLVGNHKEEGAFLLSQDGVLYLTRDRLLAKEGICSARISNNGIEVMQFTGLKDMSGKEIYEGDLLREIPNSEWEKTNFSAFEVFWHDNDCADRHVGFQMNRMHNYGAVAGGSHFGSFLPKYTQQMIIIGNIYENPEFVNK